LPGDSRSLTGQGRINAALDNPINDRSRIMKYLVTATISLGIGAVLGLNKSQAGARSHLLKDLGKGRYETLGEVQFKAGEEITYEGEIPKMYADVLVDEAKVKKAKEKAVAAEKAAAGGKSNDEPTVADIKAKLDALGIEYDNKANKAQLADLLEYAEKVAAKARELSGLEPAAFDQLSAEDRKPHFDAAEKALEQ
jgi:hypothetical protein